jgi:hypothetical protein
MSKFGRREFVRRVAGAAAGIAGLGLVGHATPTKAAPAITGRKGYALLPEEFFETVHLHPGHVPEFPGPFLAGSLYVWPSFFVTCGYMDKPTRTDMRISDIVFVPTWELTGCGKTVGDADLSRQMRLNVIMGDLMRTAARQAHGLSVMPTTREHAEERLIQRLRRFNGRRLEADRVKFWEQDGILYAVNMDRCGDSMIHVTRGTPYYKDRTYTSEQGLAILDSRVIAAERIVSDQPLAAFFDRRVDRQRLLRGEF